MKEKRSTLDYAPPDPHAPLSLSAWRWWDTVMLLAWVVFIALLFGAPLFFA